MKIATWNVNSVKARLEPAIAWLKAANPDVVALQEIKCTDDTFPAEAFEALGYNCAVHGQKTYNGVAILSKRPMEDVTPRLKGGNDDDHARYIEAVITGSKGTIRVASIYAPNGNPVGTEKFAYKLAWLERLRRHAADLLANEEPLALMGDYNIIPEGKDVHDPKLWINDALFQPQSQAITTSSVPTTFSCRTRERSRASSSIIARNAGSAARCGCSRLIATTPRRPGPTCFPRCTVAAPPRPITSPITYLPATTRSFGAPSLMAHPSAPRLFARAWRIWKYRRAIPEAAAARTTLPPWRRSTSST